MSGRVLVVGSVNIDVVLPVDRLPEMGETVVTRGAALESFGGKGANQAVAVVAAGVECALLGRVGADVAGANYLVRLDELGVDVRHLLPAPGWSTGTAYVSVDRDGENSIVVAPGANYSLEPADLEPVSRLGPSDVLLVQCELRDEVVVEAIRRAHAAGARVVLNLAPTRYLPADVVALADPMVLNEEEHRSFTTLGPAMARIDEQFGPGNGPVAMPVPASVVVTRGARGASWDDLEVPAVPVDPADVVDTTGAGDAFCGALAAALATGLSRTDALHRALAAGADAVRRVGAQPELMPDANLFRAGLTPDGRG